MEVTDWNQFNWAEVKRSAGLVPSGGSDGKIPSVFWLPVATCLPWLVAPSSHHPDFCLLPLISSDSDAPGPVCQDSLWSHWAHPTTHTPHLTTLNLITVAESPLLGSKHTHRFQGRGCRHLWGTILSPAPEQEEILRESRASAICFIFHLMLAHRRSSELVNKA